MRRLPLLSIAAAILLASSPAPAFAQEGRTFVIGDDGGYGLSDCFTQGIACGRMLADSLCAARGRGAATAFGLASDITASVPGEAGAKIDPSAIVITCGD
jgi:hypothetical protein